VTPITGATRVAGVIGDPVRHSLSPVLHNAAYQTMGLDWAYVAFEVPDGGTKDALEAMRTLGLAGLSVTMPHKTAAAHACDELADDAATLLSVNTVTAVDGRLVGSSTDGEGFLRSLADAGVDPSGQRVLLLGAGGAARAVALALGRAGAQVHVSARNSAAAAETAGLGRGSVEPWEHRHECALLSRIVVNATPIGMAGRDPDGMPINPDQIEAAHTYVDLVYHPLETNFLRAARERAAARVDGLGMLVHQAALQVERWTGFDAPVDAMRTAAKAALANSR
jgi:shikimate dehydrogenase